MLCILFICDCIVLPVKIVTVRYDLCQRLTCGVPEADMWHVSLIQASDRHRRVRASVVGLEEIRSQ